MKFKIVPIDQTVAIIDDAKDASDAIATFAGEMSLDMNLYFKAIPLDPERKGEK